MEKESIKKESNKPLHSEVSIKQLLSESDVQEVLKKHIRVPNPVLIKKAKKAYEDSNSHVRTQKIEAVSGTTLLDMENINFTLFEAEIDPVKSINKLYKIIDYTVALEANMDGREFKGYAATGLKLFVTKIEEVQNG